MREAARAAGQPVRLDSAGTGNWHAGDPPDPRAQAMAARFGADISHLRARQVQAGDFDHFDHIVAMDRDNLADLRRIAPKGSRASLSLMLDHAPGREGRSVADPYFGDASGFEATWHDVSAGANGLLALIAGRR